MSLDGLGNSNIGLLSDCVFALMVCLNPGLFVRILVRPGASIAKSRNRVCNSCLLYGHVNDICGVPDFLSDGPHSTGPIAVDRTSPFASQCGSTAAAQARFVV
jgi:hypothetical protein